MLILPPLYSTLLYSILFYSILQRYIQPAGDEHACHAVAVLCCAVLCRAGASLTVLYSAEPNGFSPLSLSFFFSFFSVFAGT